MRQLFFCRLLFFLLLIYFIIATENLFIAKLVNARNWADVSIIDTKFNMFADVSLVENRSVQISKISHTKEDIGMSNASIAGIVKVSVLSPD